MDLLRRFPDKARNLVKASRRTYGWPAYMASFGLLPVADKMSHRWLKHNHNPFLYEIETFSDIIGVPGIYALNLSYEWGCTSGAYSSGATVTMLRVLDWPTPALGKELLVVLQKGKAGDFYNLTWPGLSGVFTAMAPGRFCVALNQAPSRQHKRKRAYDWVRNVRHFFAQTALPTSHLLRLVCEQAQDYDAAKKLLMETPIATPGIYTLTGIQGGQGCVIERLENAVEIRELGAGLQVTASNHFLTSLGDTGQGWRAREIDSHGRHKQSCAIHGHDLEANHFDWLSMPVVNANTRLCMIADAATSRLVVQGFEGVTPATEIFTLPAGTG